MGQTRAGAGTDKRAPLYLMQDLLLELVGGVNSRREVFNNEINKWFLKFATTYES